jgi:hypothetical protein
MAHRQQGLPPPPRVAEPKAIQVLQARETMGQFHGRFKIVDLTFCRDLVSVRRT